MLLSFVMHEKGMYVLMNAGIIPLICHPKTWKTNSRLNIQSNASLVLIDVIEFLERTKNCENPEAKLRSRRCGKKLMCYQKFVFLLHIFCLLYNVSQMGWYRFYMFLPRDTMEKQFPFCNTGSVHYLILWSSKNFWWMSLKNYSRDDEDDDQTKLL